jgi:hypothetical protein
MYMRVTRSRMDPARIDEASPLVQDIVAAIRRLPGFQSLTIGGDRATGQSISVSTWDTEEHARWSPDGLGDLPSKPKRPPRPRGGVSVAADVRKPLRGRRLTTHQGGERLCPLP